MTGLDQILFGLSRQGGIGPLAVAGHDWEGARMWDARLRRFYRLNQTWSDGVRFAPARTLSYLRFGDGRAALLTRFDNADDPGRNYSHALVGPEADLNTFAPFLARWPGWIPEPGTGDFRRIEFAEWHALRVDALAEAHADITRLHEPAVNLVRAVLAHEGGHFAPITDFDPLPLLIIVREVLEPVLPGVAWTFSTFEKSDTEGAASPQLDGAPLFWCLRGTDYGETARHRVDTGQRPLDDDLTGLAVDLVNSYARDPEGHPKAINRALTGISSRTGRIRALMEDTPTPAVPSRAAAVAELKTPPFGQPAAGGQDVEKALAEIKRVVKVLERRIAVDHRVFAVGLAVLVVLTVIGWLI